MRLEDGDTNPKRESEVNAGTSLALRVGGMAVKRIVVQSLIEIKTPE